MRRCARRGEGAKAQPVSQGLTPGSIPVPFPVSSATDLQHYPAEGSRVIVCCRHWGLSPTVREGSKNVAQRALPDGRASAPLCAKRSHTHAPCTGLRPIRSLPVHQSPEARIILLDSIKRLAKFAHRFRSAVIPQRERAKVYCHTYTCR